jgi:NhaP-type Na+/H+ or K+/H+ antiporter
VLAPTDPVLASAVQVATPTDRDRLRFTLTGEAGLNDGTAFPFVMLGLGLLGLHGIGVGGWRWWAVDVVWAIGAGLAIGALFGAAAARLVLHLRRRYGQAVGTDDFLALGLIALAYGAALAAHAYGFLAVFAAGLALGRVDDGERRVAAEEDAPAASAPAGATAAPDIAPPDAADAAARDAAAAGAAAAALPSVPEHPTAAALALADPTELATDARLAPAFLAQAVLGFSQQLERIGEVAVVVVMGVVLATSGLSPHALWLAPLLFLVIRPLSVLLATSGQGLTGAQRALTGWFGVRGIGSVYYLAYAIAHGVVGDQAYLLADVTLTIVAASVVVHGVSVTPLMRRYDRTERGQPAA